MSDPNTIRLFSWNVNGLRACGRKGFREWLDGERPDVLGLQETRALPEQLAGELREPDGYHVWFHPAEKKGYSGVARVVSPLHRLLPQRRQRPQPGSLQARVLRGCPPAHPEAACRGKVDRHLRRRQHRALRDRPREPRAEQEEHRLPPRGDYFFISSDLVDRVVDARIHPDVMGSDHCPISLTLDRK